MYKFVSSQDKRALHRAYNQLYVQDLDKKWDKWVRSCPRLAGAMFPGMTAKKLLTADFKKLVDVYFHYRNYINGLTDIQAKEVNDAAKKVFTYTSFKDNIRDFLLNPDNKFEIWNCVYCDMAKVSPFDHKGKRVRRFDTEHVLDKGNCPLVALSLYNFVPSCATCNGPAIKGTQTIGDTKDEIVKLSPTNPAYNFWNNVLFVVNPKATIAWKKREDIPDNFEIDFVYKDATYKKSVDLFGLKSRYNTDCLMEALRWLDKKDRFTPKMLHDYANLEGCSEDAICEREFKIDIDRKEHNLYRKMKEDLIGITPWRSK
mgnify:FL=1